MFCQSYLFYVMFIFQQYIDIRNTAFTLSPVTIRKCQTVTTFLFKYKFHKRLSVLEVLSISHNKNINISTIPDSFFYINIFPNFLALKSKH